MLGLETGADGREAAGRNTRYMLGSSGTALQRESNGQGHEVNVSDVGEELGAIESEFAKVPQLRIVGISRIADRWLDKTRSGIQQEGELVIDAEPDASSRNMWDGGGPGCSGRSKWYVAIDS